MRRRAPSVLLVMAVIGLFAALPSAQAPSPPSPRGAARLARDVRPRHRADLREELLELPQRRRPARRARSEHARGGDCAAASTARRSCRATPSRAGSYRMVAGLDSISMPMHGDDARAGGNRGDQAWIDRAPSGARRRSAAAAKPAAPQQRAGRAREHGASRPSSAPTGRSSCRCRSAAARGETRISHIRSIGSSKQTRAEHEADGGAARRRRTLVRRAYLDLLGLPPSPAEVAAFVADQSADAWERLIDKLLASPHYGER